MCLGVQKREAMGLPPGDTDPFFDDYIDKDYEVRDIGACCICKQVTNVC